MERDVKATEGMSGVRLPPGKGGGGKKKGKIDKSTLLGARTNKDTEKTERDRRGQEVGPPLKEGC